VAERMRAEVQNLMPLTSSAPKRSA
jgi:hypothetical protein